MVSLNLHVRTKARARLSEAAITDLVERAVAGDQLAWDGLVDQFGGLVWSVTRGYRLSDADAADVSQIVWLRLLEHLGRLRDPSRVGIWLVTTTRRECQLLCRPKRTRLVPSGDRFLEIVDEDAPAHDATLLAQERDDALWTAFRRLGDRDQALLRMLVSDLAPSYEEIGAALDMPIGSIGPTRARALARLRREMACEELVAIAA